MKTVRDHTMDQRFAGPILMLAIAVMLVIVLIPLSITAMDQAHRININIQAVGGQYDDN